MDVQGDNRGNLAQSGQRLGYGPPDPEDTQNKVTWSSGVFGQGL
jgi:hypothetical protein